MHIDPLGTSAWNTVVSGRKLWVLFPPHVDKNVAKGKDVIRQGEDDEPVRFVAQTQMNLSHLSSTLLYIYHRQFLVDNCRRGTWRKCNRRQ